MDDGLVIITYEKMDTTCLELNSTFSRPRRIKIKIEGELLNV